MASRAITHITCPCGHCGSIVESRYDDSRSHWYLATLRDLSHNGLYDGLDSLFSENTPSRARRVGNRWDRNSLRGTNLVPSRTRVKGRRSRVGFELAVVAGTSRMKRKLSLLRYSDCAYMRATNFRGVNHDAHTC
ncbi:hypothetical protein SAMN05446935_9876 [Burkholderia sp. YR290]|nr:hypothetical protein SAMN05446935_9876 [Burkholderia sp. YR290]